MEVFIWYNNKIRKVKQSQRRYCQKIIDELGGATLTKIMEKQAINRVSAIKLPDIQ
jgi:hypothetical protein